jgi:uncharacterized protein (TIGR03437 family)
MAAAPPQISLSNSKLQFSYTVGSEIPQSQSIAVSNSGGGGTLIWSAVPSAAWLTVSTTSTFTLTVLVNPTSLTPGVYHGTLTVTVPGAANSPQTVSVTLAVAAGARSSAVVVTAVTNSASGASGAIAPGEMITIYGSGLGPANGVSFTVDPSTGMIDSTLAGAQVFFGKLAAPVTYTSSGQINAIVPYELAGQTRTNLQVNYQGSISKAMPLPVAVAAPGVFTANSSGRGQVSATNQDGSVNSTANPAAVGSYVTLYITGGGQTNPPGSTGALNGTQLKYLVQNVSVTVGGQPSAVTYAGSAPGLLDGVDQLNIQLANDTPVGPAEPLVINIGGVASPGTATVAVKSASAGPSLQNLLLSASSVVGGNSLVGTVSISAPTSSATVIKISSDNPNVLVPPSVPIAAGETSAAFTISTSIVSSAQNVGITAALGARSVTDLLIVSPATSIQGENFGINGTLTLAGNALSFEIQAASNGDGTYSVFVDDQFAIASPIQFTFVLMAPMSLSGGTATFSGSNITGLYEDTTNVLNPTIANITSATVVVTFTTPIAGGAVSGTLTMGLDNGTNLNGTFTGTIGEIGYLQ